MSNLFVDQEKWILQFKLFNRLQVTNCCEIAKIDTFFNCDKSLTREIQRKLICFSIMENNDFKIGTWLVGIVWKGASVYSVCNDYDFYYFTFTESLEFKMKSVVLNSGLLWKEKMCFFAFQTSSLCFIFVH